MCAKSSGMFFLNVDIVIRTLSLGNDLVCDFRVDGCPDGMHEASCLLNLTHMHDVFACHISSPSLRISFRLKLKRWRSMAGSAHVMAPKNTCTGNLRKNATGSMNVIPASRQRRTRNRLGPVGHARGCVAISQLFNT